MKKKSISKTYLRDVTKYELKLYCDIEDYYLAVKKIVETKEPYIMSTGECAIDNGYYIVEVLPKNENYSMRVFFNDKKERVEYYFDICKKIDIDEELMIPYYEDLYLDIIMGSVPAEVLDEDELQEALDNREITQEDFDLAYRALYELLKSIKNKNNKYVNMDLEKYLDF